MVRPADSLLFVCLYTSSGAVGLLGTQPSAFVALRGALDVAAGGPETSSFSVGSSQESAVVGHPNHGCYYGLLPSMVCSLTGSGFYSTGSL